METTKKTILVYSVFSGTFYEVLEADFKLLDIGQIPLLKKPKNCSKCFDKGHRGRDLQTYGYSVCTCLRKVIDHAIIKHVPDIPAS
jgi:hypothetical protein